MTDPDVISFSLPKGSNLIENLDRMREGISRSIAIRKALEYVVIQNPNTFRSLIGLSSLPEIQNDLPAQA